MKQLLVIGVAVLVATGCGGGSRSTTPAHYRKVFLEIASPVSNARSRFNVAIDELGDHPTSTAMQAVAAPLATALHDANVKLSRDSWPPRDEQNIMQLVTADRSLIQALDSASVHRSVPPGRWKSAVIDNTSVVNSADSQVHYTLGLPPPY